jgi:hypothetical protein
MWFLSSLLLVGGVSAFPLHDGPVLAKRAVDYCAQAKNASLQTKYNYFPAPLALKCLQQLPYDQTVAEETVDSFIKTFKFYAPESYAKDSPNPMIQLSVDVPSELARIQAGIQAQQWSYFEYQYQLDTLVRSLNDGCFHRGGLLRTYRLLRSLLQGIQCPFSGTDGLVIS